MHVKYSTSIDSVSTIFAIDSLLNHLECGPI